MFRNHIISSLRYIWKNKLFSFINIAGLSLGISTFLLLFLFVANDLSYDKFQQDSDRIYRMVLERIYPDNSVSYAIIPHSFKEALETDFPEVEQAVRLSAIGAEIVMHYQDISFSEKHILFADSTFFDFFSIPLLAGNPQQVLTNPNGIVLTASTAARYFGEEDPVGKMLSAPFGELMVTGVCADVPPNSHLKFDILASLHFIPLFQTKNYISFSVYQYIKLREGYEPATLEKKFPEMVRKYAAGQIQANMGLSFEEYTKAGNGYRYYLQPLRSIHLHSQLEREIKPNGNHLYTILFLVVAVFVLAIAIINFMNLSTARSNERSRETGIRKVLGAHRYQLSRQFLMESVIIAMLALFLALMLTELVLPWFNNFTGKSLELNYYTNWLTLPLLLLLGLMTGLISGWYPSFVLSGFEPLEVIRGKFSASRRGMNLRNILVVFQFAITITLISATLLIGSQLRYITYLNPGYSNRSILFISRAYSLGEKTEAFRQEVNRLPGVINSAYASTSIAGGYYPGQMFQTRSKSSEVLTTRGMFVEDGFFGVLGLELTAGRYFDEGFNDSLSLVINEKTVKEFGLEQAIGSKLYHYNENDSSTREFEVVGVVRDFHFTSLHHPVISFIFFSDESPFMFYDRLYIHFEPGSEKDLLPGVEKIWNNMNEDQLFSYSFLEDELKQLYANENRSVRIFALFSVLAVLIAGIGLYGLASFLAERKTKEIGIRKTMGSTVFQIVRLLGWNFGKLILISFILAAPVTYIWMSGWLGNFAYRTGALPWIILVSGILAMVIAMLTVSFKSIKAGHTNPAESLRTE